MINLDDRSVVTALDPKEMLRHTSEFPEQCQKALEIARNVSLQTLQGMPRVCALGGMGGSAAGGDFVRALFEEQGAAAFVVARDYDFPHFIGVGDVVFCASYSGNTEETLACYDQAKSAGASIVGVTSGGKLAERANADGNPLCIVPAGQPPRTALGFMLMPVIHFCVEFKLIPEPDYNALFASLRKVVELYGIDAPGNPAKQLARELHGAVPVMYGLGTWQGLIANRWRSQINENSKQLAFFNSYPELNHNEILGWVKAETMGVSKFVGVRLQDGNETAKMKKRAEVTERLVAEVAKFHTVTAIGSSLLERMLTLAYIGDFVSIYLARLNEVDPENIDSINVLKAELADVA